MVLFLYLNVQEQDARPQEGAQQNLGVVDGSNLEINPIRFQDISR